METKKYYFQGLEFQAKEITLDVLTDTFQLKKRWDKHLATFTKDVWVNIRKVIAKVKTEKDKSKIKKNLETIIQNLENDEVEEAFNILKKMEDDSTIIIELKEALTDLTLVFTDALELFLLDKRNLQELFENVLNGETKNIDYSVNEKIKEAELKEFATNVFSDFFLPLKKAKNK